MVKMGILFVLFLTIISKTDATNAESAITAGGYVFIGIAVLIGVGLVGALIFLFVKERKEQSADVHPHTPPTRKKASPLDFNKSMSPSRDGMNGSSGCETSGHSKKDDENDVLIEDLSYVQPNTAPKQTIIRTSSKANIGRTNISRCSIKSNESVINRQASSSSVFVRTTPDLKPDSTMITLGEHPDEGDITGMPGQTTVTEGDNDRKDDNNEKTTVTQSASKVSLKRTMSKSTILPRQPSVNKPMNRQMSRTMSKSVISPANVMPTTPLHEK